MSLRLRVVTAEVGKDRIAVGIVGAPVLLISGLAVKTIAVGLPWLLEGLEVEDVVVPVKGSADTVGEKVLCVLGGGNSSTLLRRIMVVGSTLCYALAKSLEWENICPAYHQWATQSHHSRAQCWWLSQQCSECGHRLVANHQDMWQRHY